MPTIIDEEITENELLDELVAAVKRQEPKHTRLPGDVTTAEIMAASGKPKQRVLDEINARIAAGELIAVEVSDHGKRRRVYRKANNGA